MLPYNQQMERYKSMIESSLPKFLPSKETPQKTVTEAMEYSLCGGGKRVRGTLVLSFYQLFGGENLEAALPFAAALEMIHSYSLIHDDLPCMDDDDLRRGKPSCHIAFGESTALLAGDGLLTLAFQTLSTPKNLDEFSAEQLLAAVHALAVASGVDGMIGGQVLDLANEEKQATAKEVEEAELKKTGALIAVSAQIGSILGGATTEEQEMAISYGKKIGLAFQVLDDILDATSTVETLGKPINSDVENNKSTYTSLFGIDGARGIANTYSDEAIELLKTIGGETAFLEHLTKELSTRNY